jgi:hypothetical protein
MYKELVEWYKEETRKKYCIKQQITTSFYYLFVVFVVFA